jgi:predicted metal-dependent HD superfamily phosphohydrolase
VNADVPALEAILGAHVAQLGGDFTGYRNHTYRVLNLCGALQDGADDAQEKIAVAAAFHDLGIWTDGTFDYLAPSAQRAEAHLRSRGNAAWIPEVTQMILQHHKVRPAEARGGTLVEAFRRADWIDVSRGAIRFGVSRQFVRELYAAWPSAGFHWRLVQFSWRRLLAHPFSPLPMLRW